MTYKKTKFKEVLRKYEDNCIANMFKGKMHCNYVKNNKTKAIELDTNHILYKYVQV